MPIVPDPIGGVAINTLTHWQRGEIADDGTNQAFVYTEGSGLSGKFYLWLNGTSYEIDDETYPIATYKSKVLIIPGQSYVYIVLGGIPSSAEEAREDWIKIYWLNFSGQDVGSKTWEITDGALMDAIVTEDNRILIVWYEDIDNPVTDLPIYYSYGDYNGWTDVGPSTIANGSQTANDGALTQLDSSTIWLFVTSDSQRDVNALELEISEGVISVANTYAPLIDNGDGDLTPEGEMPNIRAITVSNYMLVAYQNKTYYQFSVTPFIKGANIAIARVESDATFSEEAIIEEWFERISPFSLGYRSDWGWYIVGSIINDAQTEFNKLYLLAEGGRKRYFGVSSASYGTNYTQVLNYDDWVVARMDDDYLRFYSLEKPTGPFPTHFVV